MVPERAQESLERPGRKQLGPRYRLDVTGLDLLPAEGRDQEGAELPSKEAAEILKPSARGEPSTSPGLVVESAVCASDEDVESILAPRNG